MVWIRSPKIILPEGEQEPSKRYLGFHHRGTGRPIYSLLPASHPIISRVAPRATLGLIAICRLIGKVGFECED